MNPKWTDTSGDLLIVSLVAGLFGFMKILLSEQKLPMKYHIVTLFVSSLVGTLGGMIALENNYSNYLSLMITAVLSLASRNIVSALLDKKLTTDLIKRAAENIVDKTTK